MEEIGEVNPQKNYNPLTPSELLSKSMKQVKKARLKAGVYNQFDKQRLRKKNKEEVVDLVEYFVVVFNLVSSTFVFLDANERKQNYLLDMGFRNLKEIFEEIANGDKKIGIVKKINTSIQDVIDSLKYDVMVSEKFTLFRKKITWTFLNLFDKL